MKFSTFRTTAIVLAAGLAVSAFAALPKLVRASAYTSIFTATVPRSNFDLFSQVKTPAEKISDAVRRETADGERASVVILLAEQADVSAAYGIADRDERGWYVYNTLTSHAEATQQGLRSFLASRGAAYQSFWAANMIVANADSQLIEELSLRPDVARIDSNRPTRWIEDPEIADFRESTDEPEAIEWGVSRVNAPQVWGLGFTGQGIVVGNLDTGIRWTHASLRPKYRGWNGTTADHNYNWWDAIHSGGGTCGPNTTVPCDDNGHGTHTTATSVGDDGGANQVGVAPGAKWIGCRNMNQGVGSPATYTECFQFMMAPTDSAGNNPDPTRRAHVLNNSWGCPASEGCTTRAELQEIVNNVDAAGIFVVVSAGNSGSGCSTVSAPPAIYDASFSVGAFNIDNNLASFSSRGPSTFYTPNILKPNISAPGVSVRSATRTSDTSYGSLSGTSMAGPHVAGVVALLWSARPDLIGNNAATKALLQNTANPTVNLTTPQTCGGISSTQIPNNSFGYGRVDALAAVNAAGGGTPTPTPTNTPTATPTNTPTATPTATPITPVFTINSVTQPEGNAGTSAFVFTITRTGDNGQPSSVRVSTTDQTATVLNNDYAPVNSQLVSFPSGSSTQQIAVTVNGDIVMEDNETFHVNLHDAINAVVSGSPGIGTILNDDTTFPPGVEGDVAPRGVGDLNVDATDVIQVRRFAISLDIPTSSEAQRADTAPRASRGDGVIDASDVIQTRRYASGLDPATPTGGPSFSRPNVEVLDARTMRGQMSSSTIPISITASSPDEAQLTVIEYDATIFSNPRISLAAAAPIDTYLAVNDREPGRLAILIDSTSFVTRKAHNIAVVTFDLLDEKLASSSLWISDPHDELTNKRTPRHAFVPLWMLAR